MEFKLAVLFILFIGYSILGWAIETVTVGLKLKRFVDRGFLIGPYCPIYGVGSILMVILLYPYQEDPLTIFVFATIIATIVEYITGYLLEKIFRVRWWDYSEMPFNLNGRIVLSNSIAFGFLGLLVFYVINPFYENLLSNFNEQAIISAAIIIAVIFIIDIIVTGNVLFKIRKDVKPMLKDRTEEFSLFVKTEITRQVKMMQRIAKAFPNLEPLQKKNIVNELKNKIKKRG